MLNPNFRFSLSFILLLTFFTTPLWAKFVSLDTGQSILLKEDATYEFLMKDETLTLKDGREINLTRKGNFRFGRTAEFRWALLKDGRILIFKGVGKYEYYKGETLPLDDGRYLNLKANSTYTFVRIKDELLPLKDGSLLQVKANQTYRSFQTQSDFSVLYIPVLKKLHKIWCPSEKTRSPKNMEDLSTLSLQLADIYQKMRTIDASEKELHKFRTARSKIQDPACPAV